MSRSTLLLATVLLASWPTQRGQCDTNEASGLFGLTNLWKSAPAPVPRCVASVRRVLDRRECFWWDERSKEDRQSRQKLLAVHDFLRDLTSVRVRITPDMAGTCLVKPRPELGSSCGIAV